MKRLVLVVLAAASVFFAACGNGDESAREKTAPVAVKAVRVEISPLRDQSAYSGTVEPIERVRLSTRVPGWVERIPFDEGDAFARGELLVKLRSKDLEAKRSQAEAAIAEANVHFNKAETNLRRIEALFKQNAATQKELDDMQAAFASARSRKIAAEKMKVEVDEMLKYTNMTAPFSGVVARKLLQAGDLANPGQPLLEIENADKVKIIAKVPESEIGTFTSGMKVAVRIQALKIGAEGELSQGVVDKILPAADPVSRQFDIHVVLDNSGGKIRSGMFARILTGGGEDSGLLVPESAVFRRGQLQGVFVVDSAGVARLRWVRAGGRQNGRVNVLSGLNPGEQVVTEGADRLLDGQPVEVN